MLPPWKKGKVIRIEDETPQTKRFWIEVQDAEGFEFRPGQFVTLDLPIHEQRNKRWRSYSIASWPDGSNVIELVIVHLEGGAGTEYLFREVTVGSELDLRGPQGVFVLPDHIDRDLFLVCTGTGIAPFRSMVHHIIQNNIPHKNIYLVFGCRKISDTLYGPELHALEEKEASFFFLPTYSREEPGQHLVRTGYVHGVYEELLKEKMQKAGMQLHPAMFYLCGWKNMITEAKERLLALGYDKKAIHLELYG